MVDEGLTLSCVRSGLCTEARALKLALTPSHTAVPKMAAAELPQLANNVARSESWKTPP